MLLGFISLLLTVFQSSIQKICVPLSLMRHMLPCKNEENAVATAHYQVGLFSSVMGSGRRLLAGGSGSGYCAKKVKILETLKLL